MRRSAARARSGTGRAARDRRPADRRSSPSAGAASASPPAGPRRAPEKDRGSRRRGRGRGRSPPPPRRPIGRRAAGGQPAKPNAKRWMRAGIGHRRQPDVMRMLDRRDLLAAIEQDREFRRQGMIRGAGLERREHAIGQGPSVDLLSRIEAGGRADHDVADIVAALGQRPESARRSTPRPARRPGPPARRGSAGCCDWLRRGRRCRSGRPRPRQRPPGRRRAARRAASPGRSLRPAPAQTETVRDRPIDGWSVADPDWFARGRSMAPSKISCRPEASARSRLIVPGAWNPARLPRRVRSFVPRRLRQANRFYTTARSDRRAIWSGRCRPAVPGRRLRDARNRR